MSPDGPIKLVSELLDLPLIDSEGKYCGIVDDIELEGSPGKALKVKALLVGPGAYGERLPAWAMPLVRLIAGKHVIRVALDEVKRIGATVQLGRPGMDLGLLKSEAKAGRWIPRKGAL
jgi:sporulation protein YlmC with PRC-barrel domain